MYVNSLYRWIHINVFTYIYSLLTGKDFCENILLCFCVFICASHPEIISFFRYFYFCVIHTLVLSIPMQFRQNFYMFQSCRSLCQSIESNMLTGIMDDKKFAPSNTVLYAAQKENVI
jgi:hypothetical protein